MNREKFPSFFPATEEHQISQKETRAAELLLPKHAQLSIDPREFKDTEGYKARNIEKHLSNVKKKRERLAGRDWKVFQRASLLEAILSEQIELSDWLGENTMTVIPSEYDDLYNGTDMAIEFQTESFSEPTVMGIDIVSSPNPVKKKMAMIREKILSGELTRIEYFQSAVTEKRQKIKQLPLLLAGADLRTINELAALWLNSQKSHNPDGLGAGGLSSRIREAKNELAKHRTAVLILQELKMQLEAFLRLAEKTNQHEAVQKYQELLKIIIATLKQKQIPNQKERQNETDDVFLAIKKELIAFL